MNQREILTALDAIHRHIRSARGQIKVLTEIGLTAGDVDSLKEAAELLRDALHEIVAVQDSVSDS